MQAVANVPAAPAVQEPLRRCIVSGQRLPQEALLRFAVDPDGTVVPDVAARLPGRGLWSLPRKDIVERAVARNDFARAARRNVRVPPDLVARSEALLARRCLDYLAMARRAGDAVAGFEKVRQMVRHGGAALLISARDGAENGVAKLRALAPNVPTVRVLDADELATVFGGAPKVHAALRPGRLADAIRREADRLSGFRDGDGPSLSKRDEERA